MSKSGYFIHPYFSLMKEGYLIRGCLTSGLTAMRQANLSDKAQCYAAFFQLYNGLERMMKIILVLDHMANHQLAPPSGKEIRSYGHNLHRLFEAIRQLPSLANIDFDTSIPKGSMEEAVLDFINRFAETSGRYFNLNKLNAQGNLTDPLVMWKLILMDCVKKHISQKKLERLEAQAKAMHALMAPYSIVVAHDLDDRELSLLDAFLQPNVQDYGAKYAVLYTFNIIKVLYECLVVVTDKAMKANQKITDKQAIPFMSEFFDFAGYEKPSILRKKKWP